MKIQKKLTHLLSFITFIIAGLFYIDIQNTNAQTVDYAEIWVTPYGTNYGTVTGSGTITDPYCTPDPVSFHSLMFNPALSTNLVIHLMAGVFHVEVDSTSLNCITALNNWKIRGAGMDVTVLQVITNHPGYGTYKTEVIGGAASGVEVSDLTIDCNMQNQTQNLCFQGIAMSGSDLLIDHCRAINWG